MQADQKPVPCDLLLDGGTIVTLDDEDRIIEDGALAITGNRVVALGDRAAMKAAWAPAKTLATAGRILLPGLVNAHNHAPLMVVRGRLQDHGRPPAYTPRIPQGHMLTAEDSYVLSRLAAWELLRNGVTTAADWYWHPDSIARAYHEAGMRAFVSGRIADVDIHALALGEWRSDHREGDATIRQTEELFGKWEGAGAGRIRCVVGVLGVDTSSRRQLVQAKALADRFRAPVHMHVNYSAQLVELAWRREGVSPVQLLDDLGFLDPTFVASHCVSVTEDDRRRIGEAHANVAHAPFANAEQGCMGNMPALEQAGARIVIGTDAGPVDMFENIRSAGVVARLQGAGPAMTARKLLDWTVKNGALALGLSEAGSLGPGRLADVTILDGNAPGLGATDDVIASVVWGAQGSNVTDVIVDGQLVLREGRPTMFDGEEVLDAARKTTRRLWEAAQRGS